MKVSETPYQKLCSKRWSYLYRFSFQREMYGEDVALASLHSDSHPAGISMVESSLRVTVLNYA